MATVKKVNALTKHRNNDCGCTQYSNPDKCVYQIFLDGWSFTPDVGNSKNRAEVFTPRWVVDKMIADSGTLPKEYVYDYSVENITPEDFERYISSRVIDIATGTGNFIATVMSNRMKLIEDYTRNKFSIPEEKNISDNKEAFKEYQNNVLKASASIYAFDIDYGNITTVYQRLLGRIDDLDEWKRNLVESTAKMFETVPDIDEMLLKVEKSFVEGEDNWGSHLNLNSGLIQKYYVEATGKKMTKTLETKIVETVSSNLKVFNGIVENDDHDMMVPGYHSVVWDFWNVDDKNKITTEKVPMILQILEGTLEQQEKEAESLKKKHYVEVGENDDNALFGFSDPVYAWDDKSNEKKYKTLLKQIADIEKKISVNKEKFSV